jgi:F-box/leucine-rich repeat protein 2/20
VLDFVAIVAARCPLLEVLESGLMQVSDSSVVALAEGCQRLRNVSLSRADVGDAGVIALATHCKQLEKLGLANCLSVTIQGVCVLAERCARLQSLVLPEQLRGEEMPPLASGGEIEWV